MAAAHRHDDIEINLCEAGELVYLFGGERVVVAPATVAIFWAARPHQLIAAPQQDPARWLTIPLPTALRWDLPDAFVSDLLRGRPLLSPPSPARTVDALLLDQWEADLAAGPPRLAAIAALEIQARVCRLAGDTTAVAGAGLEVETPEIVHAATMARYVVERFADPVRVADVAAAAGLNPGHAMTVFHRVIGTTIMEYVVQCRVAESQRLLITTDLPVARVGLAAGFGSQSQFYAAFGRARGLPPASYRRQMSRAGRLSARTGVRQESGQGDRS